MEEGRIVVDSDFCSGNGLPLKIKVDEKKIDITLRTRCDNEGTRSACKGSRNWYYFRVNGHTTNDTLVINIRNTKPLKLYRQGFKPVYRVGNRGKWEKTKKFRTFRDVQKRYIQQITFNVTEESSNKPVYFAYAYPFSYSDLETKIRILEGKYGESESVYFHNDIVIKSLKGRNLYCLTISGRNGISEEREELLPGLFHPDKDPKKRSQTFPRKPIYYLTSRIHPGETPSSHMTNGFIDYILGKTEAARQLLERYVFKIIPMLNPDGVSQGSWRYHSLGFELNGCFWDPDMTEEPVIFGAKEMMKYLYCKGNLSYYMDLHAHVNMKNAFIFGNSVMDEEEQVKNILYARLASSICPHVDFNRCNFSHKRMENFTGTGRVAFYTQSRMTHCYTLEVNFHSGDRGKNVVYTKKHFFEVGKSLALSLLYMDGVGEKRERSRVREEGYVRREMKNRVKLWRNKSKVIVPYAFERSYIKLMNEFLDDEEYDEEEVNDVKKRVLRALCSNAGVISAARKELQS